MQRTTFLWPYLVIYLVCFMNIKLRASRRFRQATARFPGRTDEQGIRAKVDLIPLPFSSFYPITSFFRNLLTYLHNTTYWAVSVQHYSMESLILFLLLPFFLHFSHFGDLWPFSFLFLTSPSRLQRFFFLLLLIP